jgi:hypothetical protein
MSFWQDGPTRAYPTNGDQHANIMCFMDLASDGTISLHTAAGGKAIGVMIDDPRSGAVGTVQIRDTAKVIAGAAVATGAEVQIDGSGHAITAATTGHAIVGICEKGCANAGSVIPVLLQYRGIV